MAKRREYLSVVIPVYNEEDIIKKTVASYYNELKGKVNFEMILAEDGSTDNTKEEIKKLKKTFNIKAYMEEKRKGYCESIKDAIKHTNGDWIFIVDSDFQFDPKDFWKLWHLREGNDMVIGKRPKRGDGLYRLIISRVYNYLLRLFFNVPFRDMNIGFRLINRNCIKKSLNEIHHLKYFTPELVIRSYNKKMKIGEVNVKHLKRKGETRIFKGWRLPYAIAQELKGMFKLYWELKHEKD